MYRIDTSTAAIELPTPTAASTPGYFTGGDPTSGIAATVVSADWLNTVQEELMAPVLAAGETPSKTNNGQLLAALRTLFFSVGYRNLKVISTGVSNYTSTITADALSLSDANGNSIVARNVNVAPVLTGSGANGLDTGAVAASTWYYAWVIYNPTTATLAGLFSLSATAPTLPAGYTFSARVGTVRSSATNYLIPTIQLGRRVQYVVTAGSVLTGMPVIISGTQGSVSTPTWVAAPLANFVSPQASRVSVALGGGGGGGSVDYQSAVAPNNSYGTYGSLTNRPPLSWTTIGSTQDATLWADFVLESMNLYYVANSNDFALFCMGWEENL